MFKSKKNDEKIEILASIDKLLHQDCELYPDEKDILLSYKERIQIQKILNLNTFILEMSFFHWV